MGWSFVLSDLYGTVLGEVMQARDRKIVLPHLRVPQATFTVPLNSPRAGDLLLKDTLLKCYRTSSTGTRSLAFHGPVVTVEENGEAGVQTLAVTAAGPLWRLSRRIIPGSKSTTTISYGNPTSLLDLGTIASQILQDTNTTQFSGIVPGTITSSSNAYYKCPPLKVSAEAIAELAAGLNSFEFRFNPTEPTTYANPQNWPRIATMDCAPILGLNRLDAIFEYGTSRANVASYTRTIGRETMVNNAIVSVSGWPDGVEKDAAGNPLYHLIQRGDTTSENARGLFEEVVNDAGVLDDGLRTQIADLHLAIRKNPKQVVTFTPAPNARPEPFVDYNVGDTVRARAYVSSSLRFDDSLRIWGLTFNVDENGNENVELELVMP